jgi:hypothetical protein
MREFSLYSTVITACDSTNICSFSSPLCLNYPKCPSSPSSHRATRPSGKLLGQVRACLGSEGHWIEYCNEFLFDKDAGSVSQVFRFYPTIQVVWEFTDGDICVTGWRPVKPPAMPEATHSILQVNRKPGLRLRSHAQLTFPVVYKARDAIAGQTCN